jgi:hypothetical protein
MANPLGRGDRSIKISFPVSEIGSELELRTLVADVRNNLEKNRTLVLYPEPLREKVDLEFWKAFYKEIDNLNKKTLDQIANRPGVYAIYEKSSKAEPEMRYVGQTDAGGAKQRLRSHVVWRNKDTKSGKFTGSKFDEVFKTVTSGGEIYISFCEIYPASLRHYVEENLFKYLVNGWNIHGT